MVRLASFLGRYAGVGGNNDGGSAGGPCGDGNVGAVAAGVLIGLVALMFMRDRTLGDLLMEVIHGTWGP